MIVQAKVNLFFRDKQIICDLTFYLAVYLS